MSTASPAGANWRATQWLARPRGRGQTFFGQQLADSIGPVIAATDYVRAFVPAGRRYLTLGTDGFGRSDTRAALRQYFQVDAASVERAVRLVLAS